MVKKANQPSENKSGICISSFDIFNKYPLPWLSNSNRIYFKGNNIKYMQNRYTKTYCSFIYNVKE